MPRSAKVTGISTTGSGPRQPAARHRPPWSTASRRRSRAGSSEPRRSPPSCGSASASRLPRQPARPRQPVPRRPRPARGRFDDLGGLLRCLLPGAPGLGLCGDGLDGVLFRGRGSFGYRLIGLLLAGPLGSGRFFDGWLAGEIVTGVPRLSNRLLLRHVGVGGSLRPTPFGRRLARCCHGWHPLYTMPCA